jgi:predicted RNA-binding Zn ribbon-like protein
VAVQPRFGIGDLLALANTRHGPAGHWHARPRADGPDHDHLDTPERAIDWLGGHGVALPEGDPSEGDLAALRRLRDLARSLADGAATETRAALDELMASARFALDADGGLRSTATGWAAVADDMLLPMLDLSRTGALVRRCGNPLCRFTFVDRSPARNRQWCDSRGCGNRTRVRRSRARGAVAA